jgi:hypothetical protein
MFIDFGIRRDNGRLVALQPGWCEGDVVTCSAATPGFQYPSDCPPPSTLIRLNLCTLTDAGTDAQ